MTKIDETFRYLSPKQEANHWGLELVSLGQQRVEPGDPYPPPGHPPGYRFSFRKGRILAEIQLLFLTKGRGIFECAGQEARAVGAGDLIVLRPGQWHRYRPDPTVGWTEQWIGFCGPLANRAVDHFLPTDESILTIGLDQQVIACFETALAWMDQPRPGHREIAATQALQILAILRARRLVESAFRIPVEDKLYRAQQLMVNRLREQLEMPQLAREVGMSYSQFRQLFKKHFGDSPGKYLRKVRIQRARDLLLISSASLQEIADATGFSSVYYFSKAFKDEIGRPPGTYRREKSNKAVNHSS